MRYLTDSEIARYFAGLETRPVAAVLVDYSDDLGDAWALMPDGSLFGGGLASDLDDLERVVAMLRARAPKKPDAEARP